MTLLAICPACRFAARRCFGSCACTRDGRALLLHIRHAYCPESFFGTGEKPAGWDELVLAPPSEPPAIEVSPEAIPRPQWPRPVRALAVLAKPGESGVGDTAQRLIGHMGGEAMKRLYVKLVGRDCGCNARREWLNLLYPYSAQQA